MLNRRKKLLWAGLALLVVLAFIYATRERDPVYQGRRLSEYLREVRGVSLGWGNMDQIGPGIVLDYNARSGKREASEAVLNVGTNALPMLVRLLGSRESRAKVWLRRWAEKHPLFKRLVPLGPDTVFQRNMSALLALYRLGPQAAPAIPKIIPMLEEPDSAGVAAVALMYIRPERESDILSLTNVFRVRESARSGASPEMLHSIAILVLSTFGTNASGSYPRPHAKSRLDQCGSRCRFRRGPGKNWWSSGPCRAANPGESAEEQRAASGFEDSTFGLFSDDNE